MKSPANGQPETGATRGIAILAILLLVVQLLYPFALSMNPVPQKVLASLWVESVPLTTVIQLSGYAAVFLLLNVLVAVNSIWCRVQLHRLRRRTSQMLDALAIFHFLGSWYLILVINKWVSPISQFSQRIPDPNEPVGLVFVCVSVLAVIPIQLLAWWIWTRNILQGAARKKGAILLTLCAVVLIAAFAFSRVKESTEGTFAEPNIILIGVDSLRHDAITDPMIEGRIPAIQAFVEESVTFRKAITPLARTYPSWMSVLTGKSPLESGIRINLRPVDTATLEDSLVADLNERGYTTVFATDERRFANIDHDHGFDQIIGPSYGAADFLIGYMSDFPLINIATNTALGKWILPFNRYNRAIFQSYRPEQFSFALERFIKKADKGAPLFLSVHFCLPHWPYVWSETPDLKIVSPQERNSALPPTWWEYVESVNAADQQVGKLLLDLQQHGFLDNSLIVLLSDHGESFRFPWSELEYTGTIRGEPLLAMSHGTSTILPSQNRILLSVQDRTSDKAPIGTVDQLTSTIDLRWTILERLGATNAQKDHNQAGHSLTPWLSDPEHRLEERILSMETGFYLPALLTDNLEISQLVEQGISHYTVAPNGLLQVMENTAQDVIENKELAVTNGTDVVTRTMRGGPRWFHVNWETMTYRDFDHNTYEGCNDQCQRLMEKHQELFDTSAKSP